MMPDINNRRVLAIAIPIVLSNITVPILGAVDTAVIGQLGKAAPVAAVGVGAILITDSSNSNQSCSNNYSVTLSVFAD